jgi:hypothetical protein
MNYIGDSARIAGYVLFGIVCFCGIASIIWVIYYRDEHVIISAQPFFLVLVSVGTMFMASTILPLSFEEPTPESGLDIACMSIPWLYVIGATLAISGLLAKTRGVVKVRLLF